MVEETASAMEMAVLGAKNCVLLASHRWKLGRGGLGRTSFTSTCLRSGFGGCSSLEPI